jgi:thiamine-phosphate pyrophosphorylase
VGQEDASYAEARRMMGKRAMIGVTCHDSRHLAMEAAEAGADYVAFGAFFDTATKAASTRAEPELLTDWQAAMVVPCVAIGGISVETARGLARAGADFLAVSAGVWAHPRGPRRRCGGSTSRWPRALRSAAEVALRHGDVMDWRARGCVSA